MGFDVWSADGLDLDDFPKPGSFEDFFFADCVGMGGKGGESTRLSLLDNLPAGDNDLMLNREERNPGEGGPAGGELGRIVFRSEGGGEPVGEATGLMVGVGLILGASGAAPRIEERIVYLPPVLREALGRWRTKLLVDASESLS